MPVTYGGIDIVAGYRIDMLVTEGITVKNESVQNDVPV
jgi:hypothetical protein